MDTFFEFTTCYERKSELKELDFSNEKKAVSSKSPIVIKDSMSDTQISDIVSTRLVKVIKNQIKV